MLAGVPMNVISAFVLFAITFSMGWEAVGPVAGTVATGMPAWEYGVREGDEFVTMNGNRIVDFTDIPQESIFSDEVDVVLRRDGALLPSIRMPARDRGEGMRQIGVGAADDGRIGIAEGEP